MNTGRRIVSPITVPIKEHVYRSKQSNNNKKNKIKKKVKSKRSAITETNLYIQFPQIQTGPDISNRTPKLYSPTKHKKIKLN